MMQVNGAYFRFVSAMVSLRVCEREILAKTIRLIYS